MEGDFIRLNLYSMSMAVPLEAIPLHHLAAAQLYRVVGAVFFLVFAAGYACAAVALPAATALTRNEKGRRQNPRPSTVTPVAAE